MKPPLRILVVGVSCSGKSTLGNQLGQTLDIPVLDLDDIGWLPNWVQNSEENFREELSSFMQAHEDWVIAGNYTSMSQEVNWWPATHVVWLSYPLTTLLYRYFTRTFKRIRSKEKVCGGNVETVSNMFNDPLLVWIFKQHKPINQRYTNWRAGKYSDKVWYKAKSIVEVERIIDEFKSLVVAPAYQ